MLEFKLEQKFLNFLLKSLVFFLYFNALWKVIFYHILFLLVTFQTKQHTSFIKYGIAVPLILNKHLGH